MRSHNAVRRAAHALGYSDLRFGNLCAVSTPTVVEVNALGSEAWDAARTELAALLPSSTAVIAGWGVAGLFGEARRLRDGQVQWLEEAVLASGTEYLWMLGGEPRHPSRWHQYVSDKYGRTSGGTFEERIEQALVAVPIGGRPQRCPRQIDLEASVVA